MTAAGAACAVDDPQWSPSVYRETLGLLLGAPLGRGAARRVYANALDPRTVVKIEDAACSFQNVQEWETWRLVADTPLARWFAPCRFISPSGVVLIQDRAEDIDKFPAEIPAFFTDLKLANFGRIGRQFVARDYGTTLCRFVYLSTKRRVPMRKVRGMSDGWADIRTR